jgi:bis(5'-adenosyl)-triphosphatase
MMESEDGDLGRQYGERERERSGDQVNGQKRGRFPAVDADESRKPRSQEEMQKEAEWLAQEMVIDAEQRA